MSNVICHYGIRGMKWGVRRNKESGSKNGEVRKKLFKNDVKNGKDRPNISSAEKILKDSGSAIDNAGKVVESASRIKNSKSKKQSKASTMSDDELKSAIARMNLERTYESLNSKDTYDGMAYTKDILGVVGSVVGIASSGIAIATTIHNLKG